MVIRLSILIALLTLGGCATMQRHPVATGVVVALVAGSIAASTNHDNRISPQEHFCGCRTQ
jgi:hypothetical protein